MSLEAATFITDLDASNPITSDLRSQGDDHLRLIKAVLKGTFPTSAKAWYNPSSAAKSGDFTILATEMNRTFLVDTTAAAVAATLPTLAAGDAGWECSFIKTNVGLNPLFITPPSGTIQSGEVSGLTKTRRCIPGHRTQVMWTGSAWMAERVVRLPVGAIIDWAADSLPVGYEYANGQTLGSVATNYPDFNAVNGGGVVSDRCGRVAAGQDDMGGIGSKNRLTGLANGVDADVFGAAGGLESATLVTGNLPPYTPAGTNSVPVATVTGGVNGGTSCGTGGAAGSVPLNCTPIAVAVTAPNFTGSAQGGTSTPFNNVQPTIITNFLVVVE